MDQLINNFIEFYKKAEKLKWTTRHSWLSDNKRQESVAEHSWMLGLLAILFSPHLEKEVDLSKVLKMVIVHDLAESVTGDIPSHETSERQTSKHEAEKNAFDFLVADLPEENKVEMLSLWDEFEENKTPEANFANALDKMEAPMQHNLSGVSSWSQGDFNVQPYYKDEYFNFDSFVRKIKDKVDEQSMEIIIKSGNESRIDKKYLDKYRENN